jgi:hypothetical protein
MYGWLAWNCNVKANSAQPEFKLLLTLTDLGDCTFCTDNSFIVRTSFQIKVIQTKFLDKPCFIIKENDFAILWSEPVF